MPVTWKNVSPASTAGALNASNQSLRLFNSSMDSLGGRVDQFVDSRVQSNTDDLIMGLRQAEDEDKRQQLINDADTGWINRTVLGNEQDRFDAVQRENARIQLAADQYDTSQGFERRNEARVIASNDLNAKIAKENRDRNTKTYNRDELEIKNDKIKLDNTRNLLDRFRIATSPEEQNAISAELNYDDHDVDLFNTTVSNLTAAEKGREDAEFIREAKALREQFFSATTSVERRAIIAQSGRLHEKYGKPPSDFLIRKSNDGLNDYNVIGSSEQVFKILESSGLLKGIEGDTISPVAHNKNVKAVQAKIHKDNPYALEAAEKALANEMLSYIPGYTAKVALAVETQNITAQLKRDRLEVKANYAKEAIIVDERVKQDGSIIHVLVEDILKENPVYAKMPLADLRKRTTEIKDKFAQLYPGTQYSDYQIYRAVKKLVANHGVYNKEIYGDDQIGLLGSEVGFGDDPKELVNAGDNELKNLISPYLPKVDNGDGTYSYYTEAQEKVARAKANAPTTEKQAKEKILKAQEAEIRSGINNNIFFSDKDKEIYVKRALDTRRASFDRQANVAKYSSISEGKKKINLANRGKAVQELNTANTFEGTKPKEKLYKDYPAKEQKELRRMAYINVVQFTKDGFFEDASGNQLKVIPDKAKALAFLYITKADGTYDDMFKKEKTNFFKVAKLVDPSQKKP